MVEALTAVVVFSGWGINLIILAEQKLNLIVLTGKKLGSLIRKLVSCSAKDLEKIEGSLVQLNILLIKIKGILALAVVDEVKDPGILLWLKHIQHSAYIAEDLIDRLYIKYIQGSCENSKVLWMI